MTTTMILLPVLVWRGLAGSGVFLSVWGVYTGWVVLSLKSSPSGTQAIHSPLILKSIGHIDTEEEGIEWTVYDSRYDML